MSWLSSLLGNAGKIFGGQRVGGFGSSGYTPPRGAGMGGYTSVPGVGGGFSDPNRTVPGGTTFPTGAHPDSPFDPTIGPSASAASDSLPSLFGGLLAGDEGGVAKPTVTSNGGWLGTLQDIGGWANKNPQLVSGLLKGGLDFYEGQKANALKSRALSQNDASLAERKREYDTENAYRTNPQYRNYLMSLASRFGMPAPPTG